MTDRARRVLRVTLLLAGEVALCAGLYWVASHLWAKGAAIKADRTKQQTFAAFYGGSDGLDAVRNPDSVDVWLVGLLKRDDADHSREIFSPPGNIEEPPSLVIRLNAEQMARFVALVDEPDAYEWTYFNLCGFHLDACALFKRGKDHVQLEFCFGCSDARSYLNGEQVGGQRPMTPETDRAALEFFEELFPGQTLSRPPFKDDAPDEPQE